MSRIVKTVYHVEGLKFRIALVSDVHDMRYGNLVEVIRDSAPDIILLAGDIIERTNEELAGVANRGMEEWQTKVCGKNALMDCVGRVLDVICTSDAYEKEHYGLIFIEQISTIAPVYYSRGNHEWYYLDSDLDLFDRCDVTLLNNEDVEAEIKGQKFRIGGSSTMYDLNWLKEYSLKDGFKILLCHHPEQYRYLIKNTDLDTFNLVLGGHYHGGQCRIGNRSVYIPRMGFMMKDMVGQFGNLIIGAGGVNTSSIPRFGNPCEVVVIEGT